MKSLSLHEKGCNSLSDLKINFEYQKIDQYLSFNFIMPANFDLEFNINKDFNRYDFKGNWGLWNHDVFEVFLMLVPQNYQTEDLSKLSYFEFQMSPIEQYFSAKVIRARQIYQSLLKTDLKSKIYKNSKNQKVYNLKINLDVLLEFEKLKINECSLYVNAFCVLGSENQKSYFGLKLDQNILDFHLPYLFMPLEIYES